MDTYFSNKFEVEKLTRKEKKEGGPVRDRLT